MMPDQRSEIGPRENLRLSESEKDYLETGEVPGTYSQQSIESRVKDTVRKLPARIDILAEDVELLDGTSRETIPFEYWRDCWFEIIGVEQKSTQYEIEQGYTYSSSTETDYPTSGLVEFGETLGRLANSFYMPKDKDSVYDNQVQIILGFVNGVTQIDGGTGSGEHREKLIDFVTQALTEQSESLAQMDNAIAEDRDEYFENIRKSREIIRKILDEEDIQGPAPIWILEKAKGKHVRTSEYRPHEMQIVSDTPVEEEFTKRNILEIIEDEKLLEKVAVHEYLEKDFHLLIDTHWRGVEASEIIEKMFQSKTDGMSLSEINDKLDSKKDCSRLISKLTADLSGRESPWDKRPLVQKTRGVWKLTNYGKAMSDCFSERIQMVGEDEPLPGFPSEDLLEAAIEDVCISE